MNQSERIEQVIRSSFDLLEYGSDYHNSNHLKVFQLLLIKNNQSVFLKTIMDPGPLVSQNWDRDKPFWAKSGQNRDILKAK